MVTMENRVSFHDYWYIWIYSQLSVSILIMHLSKFPSDFYFLGFKFCLSDHRVSFISFVFSRCLMILYFGSALNLRFYPKCGYFLMSSVYFWWLWERSRTYYKLGCKNSLLSGIRPPIPARCCQYSRAQPWFSCPNIHSHGDSLWTSPRLLST